MTKKHESFEITEKLLFLFQITVTVSFTDILPSQRFSHAIM